MPKSFPKGAVVLPPTEQPAVTPAPKTEQLAPPAEEPPAVSAPPAETSVLTPAPVEVPSISAVRGSATPVPKEAPSPQRETAISSQSAPQPELSVVTPSPRPSAQAPSPRPAEDEKEEVPSTPPVPTAVAAVQPPVSGMAAVVLVAGLGVLGTALLWKLLGKRR